MKEDEWDRLLQKGGRLGELAQRADAGGELEKIRGQIEMMREKSRRRLGRKFELLLGQEHEYGYFDRNLLERYVCLGDDFVDEDELSATTASRAGSPTSPAPPISTSTPPRCPTRCASATRPA